MMIRHLMTIHAVAALLTAGAFASTADAIDATETRRRLSKKLPPLLARKRKDFLKTQQRAQARARAPPPTAPPPTPPVGERYDPSRPPRVQAYYAGAPAGFSQQYMQRIAVFALCRRLPSRACCYVHSPMTGDAITGLKSDARCAHYEAGKATNAVVPRFLKPNDMKWYLAGDTSIRKELRALYDAVPHAYKPHDCAYRIHARRGHQDGVVPNASYTCLVRSIMKRDPAAKVCVFADGTAAQFGALAREPRFEFVLNGNPAETFHNLVTAPHLFLGHSSLSAAASFLATQANVYTVPWEPGASRAVATCWTFECDCYPKRKDTVCCTPRNAKVENTLRDLDPWFLFGVNAQAYDRDPRGDGTWAPLPPPYPNEEPWVAAWRAEETLYTHPWRPPRPSYPDEGPDYDLSERLRRERGIKATPAPTQKAWDEKPSVRERLHWAVHVARGIG